MKHAIETLFLVNTSPFFRVALGGRKAKPRPEQAAYAVDVDYALKLGLGLDKPSIALLQAETGIGKSHGYMVPAAILAAKTGGRVIVSTNTINLQNQLMTEIVPGILEMIEQETGTRLKAARRIGRSNFLNVEAFEAHVGKHLASSPPLRAEMLSGMVQFVKQDPEQATIQNLQQVFEFEIAAYGLPFSLELFRIGSEGHAGYDAMVARAVDADILIINHALLLRNSLFSDRILSIGARDADRPTFLIVDEADTLPEVAKSVITRRIPLNELHSLCRRAKVLKVRNAKALLGAVADLARVIDSSRQALGKDMEIQGRNASEIIPIGPLSNKEWVSEFQGVLTSLSSLLAASAMKKVEDGAFCEILGDITFDLEPYLAAIRSLTAGDNPASFPLLYWTPVRQFPGMMLGGGDPGRIVSLLWRSKVASPTSIILTSATLQSETLEDKEDFLGYMRSIDMHNGPTREDVFRGRYSPKEFGDIDFVVVDQRKAPQATIVNSDEQDDDVITNPAIFEWWSQMTRAAIAEDNGNILVLTSSYKDAHQLQKQIGDIAGWKVRVDQRGSNAEVIAFRDTPRSVLISPSRWAGMDLPGVVRHLIVTRIPFEPPDQIYNAAFEAYFESVGRSSSAIRAGRFGVLLERALRKLLQGFGRPIRSVDDYATIWIGDRRWPISKANKKNWVGYVQRPWVQALTRSVPRRFWGKLDEALIFSIDEGVTPSRVASKSRETA